MTVLPRKAIDRTLLACCLLAAPAGAQPFAEASFETGLGAWTTLFGAHENGFDFGWSDTSFAGGDPGEAGGRFVRVHEDAGDLAMPRMLDTTSFAAPLDLDHALTASGRLFLDDDGDAAGLDVHLGFFDRSDPGAARVVLRISPDGNGHWRFRLAVNESQGPRVDGPLAFDGTPLAWRFDWVPSGDRDGTGTVAGTVSDGATTLVLASPWVAENDAAVDAFGVWANSASDTDLGRTQRLFVDDVRYTVPEPAHAALGAAALLALRLVRRRFARRGQTSIPGTAGSS